MANYFVRKTGSDAAAGTSAGAAWLTINKALTAIVPSGSGDTVNVGAGVYREQVSVTITPTSASPVTVVGDVDGAMTGDFGEVQWTGYDVSDKAIATGANPTLNTNGKSYLSFQKIFFVGGRSTTLFIPAGSTNLTWTDCAFLHGSNTGVALVQVTTLAAPATLTFDRCMFVDWSNSYTLNVTLPTLTGADYDATVLVRNCLFVGGNNGIYVAATGALANFGGGVRATKCTMIGVSQGFRTTSANLSTSIPCEFRNGVVMANSTALLATTSGQIVESNNVLYALTPRTNVSVGAGTIADGSYAALFHFGQGLIAGTPHRPFATPTATSPWLGFGDSGSPPAVDLLNRLRPAGGGSLSTAVGALERHDTGAKETTTTDGGTGASIRIAGPGDQDILIPVDVAATTISVKAQYDANHAATNKPQVLLVADGEVGVVAQTLTMSAAVNTWETLTFAPFTPTARGVARVRLVSRAAAGNGIAYFDTISPTPSVATGGLDHWRRGEPAGIAVSQGTPSASLFTNNFGGGLL